MVAQDLLSGDTFQLKEGTSEISESQETLAVVRVVGGGSGIPCLRRVGYAHAGTRLDSNPDPTLTVAPETEPVGELTAAEAEYIEDVRAGWNEFHSKAGGFRQVFAQTYSTRERLFEALIDAGAGSAFEGAYQAVKQLNPPPGSRQTKISRYKEWPKW